MRDDAQLAMSLMLNNWALIVNLVISRPVMPTVTFLNYILGKQRIGYTLLGRHYKLQLIQFLFNYLHTDSIVDASKYLSRIKVPVISPGF